jgi:hypothetical protein
LVKAGVWETSPDSKTKSKVKQAEEVNEFACVLLTVCAVHKYCCSVMIFFCCPVFDIGPLDACDAFTQVTSM